MLNIRTGVFGHISHSQISLHDFGATHQLEAIRECSKAPIRQGRLESPWAGVVGEAVLGEVEYVKALLAKARVDLEGQTDARVLERAGREAGYGLSEVFSRITGLKYQAAAQGVKRIEARRARTPECDSFLRRVARRLSKI